MKLTRENRRIRRKTCPSATLSSTNPTWTYSGSSPGLRGERPATNRLSHGTVTCYKRRCNYYLSKHVVVVLVVLVVVVVLMVVVVVTEVM
jgi:hypothetical protein